MSWLCVLYVVPPAGLNRHARFAGRDIPRYTEHQTVLPESNRVSDRCGRTLDWISEAPFWNMPKGPLEVFREV